MKNLKRILCLALCLMLGASAMADDLVWEGDVEAAANAKYEGQFVAFDEIAVKVWMPVDFQAVELSDDDKASGYIGYFAKGEEGAFAIVYIDAEGMTLDEYQAKLSEDAEVSDLEPGTVNGLPCLTYKSNGTGSMAFATQMGYILEISYGPIGDETPEVVALVFASIQAE